MNPFLPLSQWLEKNNMSATEKRRMKSMLVSYATTHPVKSGLLSPYAFRYATMAMASLIIVLGGTVGLSSAAARALPTDRLYPVKLWIEEYRAKNQDTPDAVIAFETKRIKTRFDEATKLAAARKLDETTSAVIQSGIEHSRTAVKAAADTVQINNPELALSATNELETTFSSNGKILAAIERGTNQSLGTIVLAAQVTTENLALEKTKFETIVAMKPNDATRVAAEEKLATLTTRLVAYTPKSKPVVEPAVTDIQPTDKSSNEPVIEPALMKTMMIEPVAATITATEPADEPVVVDETPTPIDPRELLKQAQEKMDAGQYSRALVILQQAEQILNEEQLTTTLEATYQVDTDTTKE